MQHPPAHTPPRAPLPALVHPYESTLLNVLDVGSLLVLVFTQILSISYLYLDNLQSAHPLGLDRKTVEIGITVLLFAANISVIAALVGAWIARLAFEKLTAKQRRAKGVVRARLEAGSEIEMREAALRDVYSTRRAAGSFASSSGKSALAMANVAGAHPPGGTGRTRASPGLLLRAAPLAGPDVGGQGGGSDEKGGGRQRSKRYGRRRRRVHWWRGR